MRMILLYYTPALKNMSNSPLPPQYVRPFALFSLQGTRRADPQYVPQPVAVHGRRLCPRLGRKQKPKGAGKLITSQIQPTWLGSNVVFQVLFNSTAFQRQISALHPK